ncbi:MAG: hypothetical protein ACE5D6_09350 [Candidatus Zixiibacteriota bacterium]
MRKISKLVICSLLPVIISLGCVNIKTEQSSEELLRSSERRASHIRRSWAQKLKQASPVDMVMLLLDHYDFVTNQYIDFGYDNVERWKEGESGRDEKISGNEMRTYIDQWITIQKPVLTAYDDNFEYAYEQIKHAGYFRSDFLELLLKLLDNYYLVYSVTMFPKGSPNDYAYQLEKTKYEKEIIADQLKEAVEKY